MASFESTQRTNIEFNDNIGMLYGYSTGSCFLNTGKCMYKAGLSTDTGNNRLDSEFRETLSIGKKNIIRANNNYIPLCFIQIPEGKKLKKLESELFTKIIEKGGKRIDNSKELFVDISINQIVECMNDLIDIYGGNMSNYNDNKVNYLSPEYDNYLIEKGEKYEISSNDYVKKRSRQFLGKKIKDIRYGFCLEKVYDFGGSEKNPRYCRKVDFEYIVNRKIINLKSIV